MRTLNDLDKALDLIEDREDALEHLDATAARVKNAWEMERLKAFANPELRDKQTYPNETIREAEVAKIPVTLSPCPVCDGLGSLRDIPCSGCVSSPGIFSGTIAELGAFRRTYEHAAETAKELLRSARDRMSGVQTELRTTGELV